MRRTLCVTLVRARLGYSAQIWAPRCIDLISRVERMQRRAIKYILQLLFSSTVSYSTRLGARCLAPVTFWRKYLDMVFFFERTHGLVHVKYYLFLVGHGEQDHPGAMSSRTQYVKASPQWSRNPTFSGQVESGRSGCRTKTEHGQTEVF